MSYPLWEQQHTTYEAPRYLWCCETKSTVPSSRAGPGPDETFTEHTCEARQHTEEVAISSAKEGSRDPANTIYQNELSHVYRTTKHDI
jgi:hypothetical protein